jgi:hypothetical protein
MDWQPAMRLSVATHRRMHRTQRTLRWGIKKASSNVQALLLPACIEKRRHQGPRTWFGCVERVAVVANVLSAVKNLETTRRACQRNLSRGAGTTEINRTAEAASHMDMCCVGTSIQAPCCVLVCAIHCEI